MFYNFTMSLFLVLASIIIHSAATLLASEVILRKHRKRSVLLSILNIDLIVVIIIGATIMEAVLWAGSYLWIGAFDGFEQALYFSLVTYTTLGYGDLVLLDSHRILGAIQAANGVIMFGWSTAIVVFAIQKIYFKAG